MLSLIITTIIAVAYISYCIVGDNETKQDKASKQNKTILYDPEDDDLRSLKKRLENYICD